MTTGKLFGALLMFEHWKIYNQRKVAIEESKAEIEHQRRITIKLERLQILEEREKLRKIVNQSPFQDTSISTSTDTSLGPGRDRPIPKPRQMTFAPTVARKPSASSINQLIRQTSFSNPSFEENEEIFEENFENSIKSDDELPL